LNPSTKSTTSTTPIPQGVIYQPFGRAAEYAELACNLYAGCGHRCVYCYVPGAQRLTREEWAARCAAPRPRPRILEALAREAPKFTGDGREVLLCFSCDPYQPVEAAHGVTRRALEIFIAHRVKVAVLTKAPMVAMMRDLGLLKKADARFGVTLVDLSRDFQERWEPGAQNAEMRLSALRTAKLVGLRTWVSVEPVISPAAALDVLRECARIGVGEVRIGPLNHLKWGQPLSCRRGAGPLAPPALPPEPGWRAFAREASALCEQLGLAYKLKEDLRKWL